MGQEYVNYGEVLYAPSIAIDDRWLKTAALYYDKVNRIIPPEVYVELSQEAKVLQDSLGFIKDLYPYNLQKIEEPFVEFAKKELTKFKNREKLYNAIGNNLNGDTIKIYDGKTSSELIYVLKKYGLVKDGEHGAKTFDALTGEMYMGFLAKEMAKERALPIVTSSPTFHNVVDYLNNRQTDNAFKLAALVIDGYVPRDISSIHPDKIVEFREKYDAEREAFYYEINELVSDLPYVESKNALNSILLKRKKLIDNAISDIEKAGNGIGLPFMKGVFSTVVSIYQGDKVRAVSDALDTIGVAIKNSKKEEKSLKYVLALREALDKESLAKQLISGKILM